MVRITQKSNGGAIPAYAIQKWASRVAPALEKDLAAATPVGEENPSYRAAKESWHWVGTSKGFRVYNISGHVQYPEFGTPDVIFPKNGPYLSFYSYGVKYTANAVRGQPAQKFVYNTLKRVFPKSNIVTTRSGYSV